MDVWVDEIESWETRPFSGGYSGLHELADSSLSGAVSNGGTWALFVNGRVVTVATRHNSATGTEFSTGDIEAFDGADGTTHRAPHPGIPLLIAMQMTDGETRGKYYTEDTPIEEVDETLSDGGFTGYLELSENVLSGDYYTVYQAGRSMDIAFVGNSRRLETDDEARESAYGEVGIYQVVGADIDVVSIPEPEEKADDPTVAVASDPDDATDISDQGRSPNRDATTEDHSPGADEVSAVDDTPPTETPATDASSSPDPSEEPDTPMESEATPSVESEPDDTQPTSVDSDQEEPRPTSVDSDQDETRTSHSSAGDPAPEPSGTTRTPTGHTEDTQSNSTTAASTATEQLASRSVPSLDPERSTGEDGSTGRTENRRDRPGTRHDREPSRGEPAATEPSTTSDDVTELREELASVRESLAAAETDRDAAREELADVRATLEEVREERDELRAEVERLSDRLKELEAATGGTAGGDGPSLSAAEAVAGTDLFVRYESKGKTTIKDACEGRGSPEDLTANLRIEHHTRFETDGTTVTGRPFEEWLHASQRYRFSEWIVSRLVFEIRETGSVDGLQALYRTLPAVDRVELDGTISVEADGSQMDLDFDVVFRDRMGEPLFVADLDDSRDPVSESEMAELVQDGLEVCRSVESFAAAFYVTAAFYEPEALETASDATSGSLLSRDSRLSFVKQSRKRGFHLALIEARDDDGFGLSVPEL